MCTEDIALIIAGFATIVSLFSLYIANQSNNIEKNRDNIELEKGKTALLNLTSRYFILNLQRTDFVGTTFTVKNDSSYTSNYIEELGNIASQFDDLAVSSYFTVLYKKYPMIGIMSTLIRKEIMFIGINNSLGKQYGFDNIVWERMFSTFDILKKEVKIDNNKWKNIFDNEIYDNAKRINEYLTKK